MKVTTVLLVLALLAITVDTRKRPNRPKPKPKPNRPKPNTNIKGQCVSIGPKLTARNTAKYTRPGARNCECWWDITKHDCACCQNGGVQCGYPKHKFCWKRSAMGCPGVCNNKYTLSGKGYPCYSNPSNTDCAWCTPGGYQCEQNGVSGPQSRDGSRCQNGKNKNYCKSQQGDCRHIPNCDRNAECKFKKKLNRYLQHFQCECSEPWTGNGIQCADVNGTLSVAPGLTVQVEMSLNTSSYSFPYNPADNLSLGVNFESLLSAVAASGVGCNPGQCQANYTMVEA